MCCVRLGNCVLHRWVFSPPQEYADAVMYFSNDDLMARAAAIKSAMPGFRKGDAPRCVAVPTPLLLITPTLLVC